MSTVAAVATALVALVSLVTWFLKRKNEATPEQRKDDELAEMRRLELDISEARYRGDDARAESLLRRVRALQKPPVDRASSERGSER